MRLAVIVCSTTGEGSPPDNALKLMRFLKNKAHPQNMLASLAYAILGPSTPHPSISMHPSLTHARPGRHQLRELLQRRQATASAVRMCDACMCEHHRLAALGATTFHAPGWADDGTGCVWCGSGVVLSAGRLEVVVEPWLAALWPALDTAVPHTNHPSIIHW